MTLSETMQRGLEICRQQLSTFGMDGYDVYPSLRIPKIETVEINQRGHEMLVRRAQELKSLHILYIGARGSLPTQEADWEWPTMDQAIFAATGVHIHQCMPLDPPTIAEQLNTIDREMHGYAAALRYLETVS